MNRPTRPGALRAAAAFLSLAILFSSSLIPSAQAAEAMGLELKPVEIKLLDKVQRDTLRYFLSQTDPGSGLIKDNSRPGSPASIAATGFGLAALAIGTDRGWITPESAQKTILKTLRFLESRAEHKNGFFYHFLDMRTGKRVWKSEASSIDTALLVAGALTAAQYFPGTEIERRAKKIYERIDWQWMMNRSDLICMGWTPEGGFLPYYWDTYNELIILQALALGSPSHPVPPAAWNAWFRNEDEYSGYRVVYSHSGSLFTYQYSHAFIDFRGLNDKGINYFENSVQAALANRAYSLALRDQSKSYNDYSWGLSAGTGPGGYRAYGGKPGQGIQDGTIVPHAAIGSLPFTPRESLDAMKYFYVRLGEKIYKRFGFTAGFNVDKKFFSDEYIGIDQGIILLMIENFRSGRIWEKFMRLDCINRWIEAAELLPAENKDAAMSRALDAKAENN